MENKKISKYLSLILRHQPQLINLELDSHGWADTNTLILNTKKYTLTPELIYDLVRGNDKQRFAISDDGKKIRANQGHSIQIDLDLTAIQPPKVLYHGTASRFLQSIHAKGLLKGERHHVHLTESADTARMVGSRYGSAVILTIDSELMHQQGAQFYKTKNDVWLVEYVPADKIVNNDT
ncbi:RNA 2'-phosphotransferase [Pseudoalteromonas luteoviolacea]|uniref:Probable RNA 2'-phosphotransferase n=1 Tax=Pseudoalteromonas luteoviolacea S4060-1 TaxID=1365257 RepID=A0A167N435_9GAMM|nr:RNA 2'-phosphotransferase [Pseudoalteromonas luteoviolacea]KZN67475.1 hypothetical protein N478_01625 [Pseudoalteromonas luteoviolacea S4060-1]